MKAVFISFNQAYYDTLMTIFDRHNIRGYTYWETVFGRGSKDGEPHLGSHAWPTLNSALITMIEDEKVDELLNMLHRLDKRTEALGLRAFVLGVEKTI